MKIYLAGPMRGIPQFNFPAFHKAAGLLRDVGHHVFSPAERDTETYGAGIYMQNPTGDEKLATKNYGFDLREALGADLAWICAEADAVAMLPGWENSKGSKAEKATAEALGLEVLYV